ncbi:hypothetical protein AVEN_61531-1 [Araneus ventricosus]|uniref:Uncharacterized protein n=1 Tax=Araneus ventricosus TaxID=182803 RepID=A0A4Y2I852_ARAVE|nr:hypothetical protein AVEN_61531-1 [Araneus ventricosus]
MLCLPGPEAADPVTPSLPEETSTARPPEMLENTEQAVGTYDNPESNNVPDPSPPDIPDDQQPSSCQENRSSTARPPEMPENTGQAVGTYDNPESKDVLDPSPPDIPYDHQPSCPLTTPDDHEPEEGALIDSATEPDDKNFKKTRFRRIAKPIDRL